MGRHWPPRCRRGPSNFEIRAAILPAQRWRCPCGKTIGAEESTVEHVFPRQFMGPRKIGNTVVSCERCNRRKADRSPNGCELVFLFMVNARIGVGPTRMEELWPHLRRPPCPPPVR